MKNLLLLSIILTLLSFASRSDAQTMYFHSSRMYSTVPIVRYNPVPAPFYRHYEDVRRYNAAPIQFGCASQVSAAVRCAPQVQSYACAPPVKVCTQILSQRCQHQYYYDSCGRRLCRVVTVTIYKDVYSNGGCRIWQQVS